MSNIVINDFSLIYRIEDELKQMGKQSKFISKGMLVEIVNDELLPPTASLATLKKAMKKADEILRAMGAGKVTSGYLFGFSDLSVRLAQEVIGINKRKEKINSGHVWYHFIKEMGDNGGFEVCVGMNPEIDKFGLWRGSKNVILTIEYVQENSSGEIRYYANEHGLTGAFTNFKTNHHINGSKSHNGIDLLNQKDDETFKKIQFDYEQLQRYAYEMITS